MGRIHCNLGNLTPWAPPIGGICCDTGEPLINMHLSGAEGNPFATFTLILSVVRLGNLVDLAKLGAVVW